MQSQYSSSCRPGATVTKTAGDGTTSASWLTVPDSPHYVDIAAYNREYLVLRGSTIAYVEIQNGTKLSTTYDDAGQLSTIASHLCVYGGACS
ncbi:hypothetical protein [Actinospica robiniae]|uniref:hypothetical protein n=1 Tax=Actinospica robiniae TaxID=304901 RepID=UPI000427D375|nr:hypothetical protein [Actinospica robiniae]